MTTTKPTSRRSRLGPLAFKRLKSTLKKIGKRHDKIVETERQKIKKFSSNELIEYQAQRGTLTWYLAGSQHEYLELKDGFPFCGLCETWIAGGSTKVVNHFFRWSHLHKIEPRDNERKTIQTDTLVGAICANKTAKWSKLFLTLNAGFDTTGSINARARDHHLIRATIGLLDSDVTQLHKVILDSFGHGHPIRTGWLALKQKIQCLRNIHADNHQIGSNLELVGSHLKQRRYEEAKESKFITAHFDESTKARASCALWCASFVASDSKFKSLEMGISQVTDGTGLGLTNLFNGMTKDLLQAKVIRVLVVDGCSSVSDQTGSRSSLSARLVDQMNQLGRNLLTIWCLAHRANLAFGDAVLELPDKFLRLLSVHSCFPCACFCSSNVLFCCCC